jgi:hypothetical protein
VRLRRAALLAGAFSVGCVATLFFYFALFGVQTENADYACESYPASVPGADYSDVRGVGFENSFLNLGGRCTYHMNDGSVVVTREPGWWFAGTIAGIVSDFASLVIYLARRRGYPGWLFGLSVRVRCTATWLPVGDDRAAKDGSRRFFPLSQDAFLVPLQAL